MTSIPTNNSSPPGGHPFSPHQHELQESAGPTRLDSSRSHDLLGLGCFCGGSRVVTHHVPQSTLTHYGNLPVPRQLTKRRPRRQNLQGTMQQRPNQISSFTAPERTSLQPAFTFQLTPGTSEGIHALPMRPYPSAYLADAPSSTVFDTGVHPSLSGAAAQSVAIPIPISSGPGPSSSSLPFTRMNAAPPTPGPSADGAFVPIVRPWGHADAVPTGQPAHVEPEPGPMSVSHCPCCKRRAHPLVRVDNTVQWIRPDVMELTLFLNFSSNAEGEAHESWEPRGV